MEPTDSRIVIDSEAIDDDEDDEGISNPFPALVAFSGESSTSEVPPELSSGDSIPDEGIGEASGESGVPRPSDSPHRRITALKDTGNGKAREASGKPPTLDEWQNFFGKIVLKVACNWYISYAFRGVDEDMLTDREVERLALTDEERKLIVTPLAELSNKSKFMRKHGRAIVSTGESFQSFIVLGAWMSRVNRIAAKYRPRVSQVRVNNGSSGQSTSVPNGAAYTEGTTGGRVPNGFPIYRGGSG